LLIDDILDRRPTNADIGHMHWPPGSAMEIVGGPAGNALVGVVGANRLHSRIAQRDEPDRIGGDWFIRPVLPVLREGGRVSCRQRNIDPDKEDKYKDATADYHDIPFALRQPA
jgi:hypothetical protein